MTDLYFFILTAINLFVLLFMCVLIHLSENLKPRQARGFQITFILIGCISILEMISVLVNDGPVWLRWLNILSNYLGFGLTPAVPVCLIYTLQSSDRISAGLKVAAVVEILYFLLLTVSIFTEGLVFAVDEQIIIPGRRDFRFTWLGTMLESLFVILFAGNGSKLSESWERTDLWACRISRSRNTGSDFDSRDPYYLALRNIDCSSVFSVLQ